MTKKQNKKRIKKLAVIEDFFEIKQINTNHVVCKDGSILLGIKIDPYDIFTEKEANVSMILDRLTQTWNGSRFTMWDGFVFVSNDFSTPKARMTDLIIDEDVDEARKALAEIEYNKFEHFSNSLDMIEYHVIIKGKNEQKLLKEFNTLCSLLQKALSFKRLSRDDYINNLSYYFDTSTNLLSEAIGIGEEEINLDSLGISSLLEYNDPESIEAEEYTPNARKISMLNRWKPKYISEREDYFIMNDRYYSLLIVTELPRFYSVGLWNYLTRTKEVKTLMRRKHLDIDLREYLQADLRNMEAELEKAVKNSDRETENKIRSNISALNEYVEQYTSRNDKSLDLVIAFVVSGDTLKEMEEIRKDFRDELKNTSYLQIKTFTPRKMQLSIYKYMLPYFKTPSIINSVQESNLGLPISSRSFALGYPYHYQTLEDEKGFLYGYELSSYGHFIFNLMLYYQNPELAVKSNRLTSNTIIFGGTGSGKTTDAHLFIQYGRREGIFTLWADPESQNKKPVEKLGGTYIEFGKEEYAVNLWELQNVSDDNEDEQAKYEKVYNTEQAIIQAIDRFKVILTIYSTAITDNALNVIGIVANHMYEKAGVSKHKLFDKISNNEYPILSDFEESRQELLSNESNQLIKAGLEELGMKILPMLNEHRYFFNRHTNVEMVAKRNHLIGIGMKNLLMGTSEGLIDALMYLVYSFAFNFCLDPSMPSIFLMDESHVSMKRPATVSLFDTFNRRSRKYYNATISATQEPSDYEGPDKDGIIGNTTYIIIKRLAFEKQLNAVKNRFNLSSYEISRIRTFEQGDSLIIVGDKKYFIHTMITDQELGIKGGNYERDL